MLLFSGKKKNHSFLQGTEHPEPPIQHQIKWGWNEELEQAGYIQVTVKVRGRQLDHHWMRTKGSPRHGKRNCWTWQCEKLVKAADSAERWLDFTGGTEAVMGQMSQTDEQTGVLWITWGFGLCKASSAQVSTYLLFIRNTETEH